MRPARTLGARACARREGRATRERDGGANYYHLAGSYRITHCRRARDHAPAAPRGSLRSCDAPLRWQPALQSISRGCRLAPSLADAPARSSGTVPRRDNATVKCVRTVTQTLLGTCLFTSSLSSFTVKNDVSVRLPRLSTESGKLTFTKTLFKLYLRLLFVKSNELIFAERSIEHCVFV